MKIFNCLSVLAHMAQSGLLYPNFLMEQELSTWSRTDTTLSTRNIKVSLKGLQLKKLLIAF